MNDRLIDQSSWFLSVLSVLIMWFKASGINPWSSRLMVYSVPIV